MGDKKNSLKGSIFLTVSLLVIAVLIIIFGIYYVLFHQSYNPNKEIKKGSFINNIFVSGKYSYTTTYLKGKDILKISDISNLSSPKEVGSYNLKKGSIELIFVSGNYAYLWEPYSIKNSRPIIKGFRNLLEILDISNPSSPKEVGSYVYAGLIRRISFEQGKFVYERTDMKGTHLEILDVSNPTSSKIVGTYYYSKGFVDENFFVLNNKLYILSSNSQGEPYLKIIDISNPSSPKELTNYKLNIRSGDIFVSENYVYLLYSIEEKNYQETFGIKIFNVSDSTSPKEIGNIKINLNISELIPISKWNDFYVSDGYIYLLDRNYGLKIINATDPTSPKEIEGKPFEINTYFPKIFFNGKNLYIINQTKNLRIIKA